jgi:hypothetical protein
MAEKKKYPYNGQEVEGESLEFKTQGEQWTTYELSDGSTMKIKLVLLNVARLDSYAENGDPIYMFSAQQVVGVDLNPELKKKAI